MSESKNMLDQSGDIEVDDGCAGDSSPAPQIVPPRALAPFVGLVLA